jgi:hypothetical protein
LRTARVTASSRLARSRQLPERVRRHQGQHVEMAGVLLLADQMPPAFSLMGALIEGTV